MENDKLESIPLDTCVSYSENFRDEEAEVTYQSSDGVRFRIHAVYLKAHTEGLSPPEGSCLKEVVHLTEPASILELLFKFIYPTRQPVLELEVGFDVLKNLAEAAEKYQVFPVMYVCFLQMYDTLPNHAVSVLAYALKHDYVDLINEAAAQVLDATLADVIDALPSEFYKPWFTYYNNWADVQKRALTTHLPTSNPTATTISKLAGKLSALMNISETFSNQVSPWRSAIEADITGIPKFSDVVGHRDTPENAGEGSEVINRGVAIVSCEGDEHYIGREALNACSTGFDDPLENKISVPEKSVTMRLLLRFIKPIHSPDLRTLPFDDLKDLAFAAEKYSIRQATGICRVFMKKALPGNASEVFRYAARYHYLEILDIAAPLVLSPVCSFEDTINRLPERLVFAWARYYQRWQDVTRIALTEAITQESTIKGYYDSYHGNQQLGYCNCRGPFLRNHLRPILNQLLEGPGSLKNLDILFPNGVGCSQADTAFRQCRGKVEAAIKDIPVFSSFV